MLTTQRLHPGTHVLTRVHTVLPLHLILSLPNNLLAHVPITEISSTLTSLLSAEEDADSRMEEDEDEEDSSAAPDLVALFTPGDYYPAKVVQVFPTASQSFVSQYPQTETTRLAARVEVTLVPGKVNAEVGKAELQMGFLITGEVLSEEDKGWRVGLGLGDDAAGVEGFVSKKEVVANMPGE